MKKTTIYVLLFTMAMTNFASNRLSRWLERKYQPWDSKRTIAFKAVRRNDYPTFFRMLGKGVDADAVDYTKASLLIYAAGRGRLEMLLLLLEKGADPNKTKNYTRALAQAAKKNRIDICRELLKVTAIPKKLHWGSAINYAAREGHYGIVEMFLKAGIDINAGHNYIPLHCAVRGRKIEVVKLLLSKGAKVNALEYNYRKRNGVSALAFALSGQACSQISLAEILLNAGAEVNLYNKKQPLKTFPLYLAVKTGNTDLVKLLLKHGAELNKKINSGKTIITPLSLAISCRYLPMVKVLLKHGAKATAKQLTDIKQLKAPKKSKRTDLFKIMRSYMAMKQAIASGLNINIVNRYKNTVLEGIASSYDYADFDIIKLLLKHGAKDKNYALQYAIKAGNIAAVKLLLKLGADPNAVCKEARELKSILALDRNATIILPLLLKAGIDIKYRDYNGNNLLNKHYYRFTDTFVFETLIKAGFEWKNINKKGESVAETIIRKDSSGRYNSNIKVLLKCGADRGKIRKLAEKYKRKNLLFLLDKVWKKK